MRRKDTRFGRQICRSARASTRSSIRRNVSDRMASNRADSRSTPAIANCYYRSRVRAELHKSAGARTGEASLSRKLKPSYPFAKPLREHGTNDGSGSKKRPVTFRRIIYKEGSARRHREKTSPHCLSPVRERLRTCWWCRDGLRSPIQIARLPFLEKF